MFFGNMGICRNTGFSGIWAFGHTRNPGTSDSETVLIMQKNKAIAENLDALANGEPLQNVVATGVAGAML